MNLNKISRRNFLCAVGLTTAAAKSDRSHVVL